MSHIPDLHLQLLSYVADELRETFDERGHRVDSAMDTDPAFTSGTTRGSLQRDLAIAAVSVAASRVGVDFRSVNGSGREFRLVSGGTARHFRLRKAKRNAAGDIRIPVNSESSLAVDIGALFYEEKWVFGWIPLHGGTVDEVFVAKIVGVTEGSPGYLILGELVRLDDLDLPIAGFEPTDEDLPGFEDEDVEDDGLGSL